MAYYTYMKQDTFTDRVRDVVTSIPKGKVMTYKQVAEAAGSFKAFRAVGNIMNKNRDPHVPCHRVVRSDGTPGGFAWGTEKKITLLRKEHAKGLRKGIL